MTKNILFNEACIEYKTLAKLQQNTQGWHQSCIKRYLYSSVVDIVVGLGNSLDMFSHHYLVGDWYTYVFLNEYQSRRCVNTGTILSS